MFRFRSSRLIGAVIGILIPASAFAAFVGPASSPPYDNVPGVVWNKSTVGGVNNQQIGTEFNVAGSGRIGGDFILGDTKALRIDKAGAALFYIGNWGSGPQPLTVQINGNLQTVGIGSTLGTITAQNKITSQLEITAPKFCIGASCITSWPVAGGGGDITGVAAGTGITGGGASGDVTVSLDTTYADGRYVKKAGDVMSGTLGVGSGIYSANAPTVWVGDGQYGFSSQGGTLYAVNTADNLGNFVFRTKTGGSFSDKMNIANNGDVNLNGKNALRSTDAWLRINQDSAFTAGVHTPGVFAPGSLNVGGAGGWGNPGGGNAWVVGSVGIGTTDLSSKLTVQGMIETKADGIKFPDGTIQTTAAAGATDIWVDITGDTMTGGLTAPLIFTKRIKAESYESTTLKGSFRGFLEQPSSDQFRAAFDFIDGTDTKRLKVMQGFDVLTFSGQYTSGIVLDRDHWPGREVLIGANGSNDEAGIVVRDRRFRANPDINSTVKIGFTQNTSYSWGVWSIAENPIAMAGEFNGGGGTVVLGSNPKGRALDITGNVCLNNSCITSWPAVGGGGDITGVAAGTGLSGGGASGDVTVSLDTAYADGRYVKKVGDTMTGFLTLSADPTAALHAATKQYVDNKVATVGNGDITGVAAGTGLTGGGASGDVTMSLNTGFTDGRYVRKDVADTKTGQLTINETNSWALVVNGGTAHGGLGGIEGHGFTGVAGWGTVYGVNGQSSSASGAGVMGQNSVGVGGLFSSGASYEAVRANGGNIGVYGYGTYQGIYGTNDNGNNGYLGGDSYGVYGSGSYGVYGLGTSYGVYGSGGSYGLYGRGTFMGARVQDSDSGTYAYLGYGAYTLYGNGDIKALGNLEVSGGAWKTGGGSWSILSDARLKDIQAPYIRGIDAISALSPVYFNYKDDNAMLLPSEKTYVGFVAQEVQKVIPEAVTENDQGYLMIENDAIQWAMLNAIKELKAENDELRTRIEALENR